MLGGRNIITFVKFRSSEDTRMNGGKADAEHDAGEIRALLLFT